MSKPCIPCIKIDCVVEPDVNIYSLQGLPPQPLPPVIPVPAGDYSNSQVQFNPDCPEGSTLTFTGTLPSWISIDTDLNLLIGAAGIFRGNSIAEATAKAQAALNLFATTNIGNGNLYFSSGCTEPNIVQSSTTSDVGIVVNGNFIVTVGAGGEISTSSDGTSWDSRTSGTPTLLIRVAFGNGLYVAMGSFGRLVTSPDGITWTVQTSVGATAIYGVAFYSGLWVAANTSGQIYSSEDGISWGLETTLSGYINNLRVVNGTFVAVGGSGLLATSTDGTNWTEQTTGVGDELSDIAFGAGVYVAVGENETIIYSSNLTSWTPTTVASTDHFTCVTFGNGLFVLGGTGEGEIWYSADGINWTLSEVIPDTVRWIAYYKNCDYITNPQ